MGIRFGKSFKLGKGIRLNVSKNGVGASFGVKGLRFGTGPRGQRITATLPGTGISFSHALGNGARRTHKAGSARSTQAAARAHERALAQERDAQAVATFERHLAQLISLHHEAWLPWDWQQIAHAPPPAAPAYAPRNETRAAQALAAFTPGLFDRLLGSEEKKRAKLAQAISLARAEDQAAYQAALQEHTQAMERWQWFHRVAQGVLSGDVEACQAVIQHLGPFAALEEMGSSLDIGIDQPWCVEAWFGARSPEVIPKEQLSLTPTGKLSLKAMPQGRYWELYQDHLCSVAFRIGREIFALLPIPVIFVHATMPMLNTRTGLYEDAPVLSVLFEREAFMALNFERIDPSDALSAFEHEMKFKKTRGFQPIELLSPLDARIMDT